MADVSFSLAVSHTPWRPERVVTMDRLRRLLGVVVDGRGSFLGPVHLGGGCFDVPSYREFTERAPVRVWSEAMWNWAAGDRGHTHCVFLQDDVIVPECFWRALAAMVSAVPSRVVGLHTVHPGARLLASKDVRWLTTWDGLLGVGYVLPRQELRRFLRWRGTCLQPGALDAVTEDTLIDCWTLSTGRSVWHPLPTIVEHDVSVASTYGNDGHPCRRADVTWRNARPGAEIENESWWAAGAARAPNMRLFNASTPELVRRWVFRLDEVCLEER